MKPWLVEFELIPRPQPARAGSAGARPVTWGPQRPLPPDFARRAAALGLPPASASDGAPRVWGRSDSNHLELRESEGGAATVRVAVDTRTLDPAFAAALLGLVKATNAVLVRSDGLMIDATVGAFSKALRSSPAWAHVDDPTGLLTGRERSGESDDS